jgi:hypothetical protein
MSPASRRQYPGTAHSNRNSHAKVVKAVAPDPRSRSSSSFSNDSADDEDNGVRDCRRYMSPASRRQYPGTARSDNLVDVQVILAQHNSSFQSKSKVLNPALASAELDDADGLHAIVNKCFHRVTLPSLQEVFFPQSRLHHHHRVIIIMNNHHQRWHVSMYVCKEYYMNDFVLTVSLMPAFIFPNMFLQP